MTRYAATTEVPADRSRAEIEATLRRYGATAFMYGWEENRAAVRFQINGKYVAFVLPMPNKADPQFTTYRRGSVPYRREDAQIEKLYEQATRQRWRALALVIKAKLETVESGITTFEDEFLAHLLLPDGKTFGEWAKPQLEQVYLEGRMPPRLLLGTEQR